MELSDLNILYRFRCIAIKFRQLSYLIKLDSYFFLAQFLVELDGSEQFCEYMDSLQEHDESRLGTPNYIAANIRGVGFVLACDALKELGYEEYPKPDTHLRDVCKAFELSSGRDITTFKAIRELAESCKITPYKIDKMIWLVCSGSFYKDKDPNHENKTLKVPSRKRNYLKELQKCSFTLATCNLEESYLPAYHRVPSPFHFQ